MSAPPPPCTVPATLVEASWPRPCRPQWPLGGLLAPVSSCPGSLMHGFVHFPKNTQCLQTPGPAVGGLSPEPTPHPGFLLSYWTNCVLFVRNCLFILSAPLFWSALSHLPGETLLDLPASPPCPSLISTFFKRPSVGVYQGIMNVLPSIEALYVLFIFSTNQYTSLRV